ncbi:hypothetical protein GCM10009792_02510 [Microcella alkalica]|uniref:Zn-dependent protease with chaperone function n=1 Tax=Microcella alkalica TaxID=355930 RepID=A0A839EC22_9MICO|nr:DUF1206 domain-containing protein [Microcella alkalica]MBA8847992.1 Zn-dependent protease with chaperone function [Microcella alkalica]
MNDIDARPESAPDPTPSSGWGLIAPGAVLLIIGITVAAVMFGRETPGSNDPGEFIAWNAGLTIGAAVLAGIGALLLALGFVRRRRRAADRR